MHTSKRGFEPAKKYRKGRTQMNSQATQFIPNDFKKLCSVSAHLIQEIEKAVIGKRHEIKLVLTALLAGGHVLIEDVPGVGKTTLAASLAKAAGLDFKRAQFTPDVTASDITGFNIYSRTTEAFSFHPGLAMTNILLADEINRTSPKTQAALLEVMEEKHVTVDGQTHELPNPFMVIATQNPTGFVGTYPLPESQLDRFTMKISMGYPTTEEETSILLRKEANSPLDAVRPAANTEVIRLLRAAVRKILVDPEICTYIISLITATRRHPSLQLGASPRASLALLHAAQAYAFLNEREYVIPEDIAAIFHQVVAHRLLLSQSAEPNTADVREILYDILRKTPAPFRGKR